MATKPLNDDEIMQLIHLVQTLGEDCLLITPRELGTKLGLDADELIDHFKKYFNGHNPRAVLRGEERLGAAVLVLYIPADHTGPGNISILSAKPEFTADYLKFKTAGVGTVQ